MASQGFCYPGHELNHHFLFFKTSLPRDRWPRNYQSVDADFLATTLASYYAALEADFFKGIDKHIISSEILFRSDINEIKDIWRFLDSYFSKLTVIAYVRNPVEMYSSAQQQRIRACSTIISPTKYFYDFRNTIASWSQFGRVIVRPYFPETDIIDDFSAQIGIEASSLSRTLNRANQSLSIEQMLVFEKIQTALYKSRDNAFKPHLYQLGEIKIKGLTVPKLRTEARRIILDRHQEDLNWLNENFGIRFENTIGEYSQAALDQLVSLQPTARLKDVFAVEDSNFEIYEAKLIDRLCRLQHNSQD